MRKRTRSNRYLGLGVVLLAGVSIGALLFGGKDQEQVSSSPSTTTSSQSAASSSSDPGTSQETSSTTSSVNTASSLTEEPAADVSSSSPVFTSYLNNSAILAGDFTSLKGTWVNGQGRSLTFTAAGLELTDGEIEGLEQTADGLLRGYWYQGNGGAGIFILPAGTVVDTASLSGNKELKDGSNQQADRIWMGQDYASQTDPSTYYYKQ